MRVTTINWLAFRTRASRLSVKGRQGMDTYKLKIKIGTAEFEAEGPEETVKQQFEEFKKLLDHPHARAGAKTTSGNGSSESEAPAAGAGGGDLAGLERLFADADRAGKKSVSLRFLPQGDDREATAILLLLLGHERLVGDQRMRVTALKEALEKSGLTLARVDRIADKPLRRGLLMKGGKAKGGTYTLSNTGRARAMEEVQRMLEQMA
jgi:hypothetical protein